MNEANVAERIADAIEQEPVFQSVDWNDLGEVTVRLHGRCYRMLVRDITDEG